MACLPWKKAGDKPDGLAHESHPRGWLPPSRRGRSAAATSSWRKPARNRRTAAEALRSLASLILGLRNI